MIAVGLILLLLMIAIKTWDTNPVICFFAVVVVLGILHGEGYDVDDY